MEVIVSGWAMSFRQAAHAASSMKYVVFRRRCSRSQLLEEILARRSSDRVLVLGAGRQEDRRDVVRGNVEFARRVPSGSVEDENGVCAFGGRCVRFRRGEAASCRCLHRATRGPPRRRGLGRSRRRDRRCRSADRLAVSVAFPVWPIDGQGRSSGRCGPRPQTRFRPASSPATLRDEPSARTESFFKRLDDPLVLRWMTGPRADVGEAELLCKLSDIARMKLDP